MSDWPRDWKPGDPPPPGYLVSKKGTLYRAPNPPRVPAETAIRVCAEIGATLVIGRRKHQEGALLNFFEKQHLKAIDKWIAAQDDPSMDRPEAIRRLVAIGLKATTTARRGLPAAAGQGGAAVSEPLDGDLHMALLGDILSELRRIRELLQQQKKAQAEQQQKAAG